MISFLVRRWNDFWFAPKSTINITWIRILLGLTSTVWGLALVPDFDSFFFTDGLFADPTYGTNRLGALQWLRDDWAAAAMLALLLGSAFLVTFGWLVRPAAPLLFYSIMSLQQDVTVLMNASDNLLRLWAFYYAVFAVLTPSRYLSLGPRGIRRDDGSRRWPVGPAWVLRLMQFQLTAIYVDTAIEKSSGSRWHNGTAASIALGLEEFERFYVPDFVRESVILGNIGTWVAIGLEITLPLLLWNRRTRLIGIVLGIGMHVVFDYAMRLGYFFPGMLIGYIAFMRPGDTRTLMGLPTALFRRRSGTKPVLSSA
ncbi:MAG: HTTM domain-containing protein [Acidimicrobiales bacterium]|nr:HTTM domain-containing protein [Acidimicrobiales bacterium]